MRDRPETTNKLPNGQHITPAFFVIGFAAQKRGIGGPVWGAGGPFETYGAAEEYIRGEFPKSTGGTDSYIIIVPGFVKSGFPEAVQSHRGLVQRLRDLFGRVNINER